MVEESRNLSTITVDELISSLMTYELNLKRSEESEKKKKSLALKVSLSGKESSTDNESSSSDEDSGEFTMITRKFKRFLIKESEKFRKKLTSRKRISKFNSDNIKKSDKIVCYNYRKSGHMKAECLEALKKKQPR